MRVFFWVVATLLAWLTFPAPETPPNLQLAMLWIIYTALAIAVAGSVSSTTVSGRAASQGAGRSAQRAGPHQARAGIRRRGAPARSQPSPAPQDARSDRHVWRTRRPGHSARYVPERSGCGGRSTLSTCEWALTTPRARQTLQPQMHCRRAGSLRPAPASRAWLTLQRSASRAQRRCRRVSHAEARRQRSAASSSRSAAGARRVWRGHWRSDASGRPGAQVWRQGRDGWRRLLRHARRSLRGDAPQRSTRQRWRLEDESTKTVDYHKRENEFANRSAVIREKYAGKLSGLSLKQFGARKKQTRDESTSVRLGLIATEERS